MPISQYIEHTFLKPEASKADIEKLCLEAIDFDFVGVCVPPYYVKLASAALHDKKQKVITVVGFPLGYNSISAKIEESKKSIEDGADEIDMVMNIAAFKSGDYGHVKDGIESVATFCRLKAKPLKVIIETGLLSEEEIKKACEICAEVEVDYVKTSTGFNGGVKIEDLKLMRECLPEKIKLKASGGIRDEKFAKKLIRAGANRLGTSAGIQIVNGEKK
ncbi:MAG: deoxyribose-phosphate aldolase [Bacteroidetes bacterium]|nr:deoxyribose-phosphate aldolase [Bacteroidota bacterium]